MKSCWPSHFQIISPKILKKKWYGLLLKRPWLYSTWDFQDTFHKLVIHAIWLGNILKSPMGHISGVAEPFFLKISQMWWILDFLPFWQNMLLVWLTNNNNYSRALQKRFLMVNKLKDLFFFFFLTCFLTCFDGFFASSKKSGWVCLHK